MVWACGVTIPRCRNLPRAAPKQDVPQERADADAQPSGKARSEVRFAGLVFNLSARRLARESGEAIPQTRGEFRRLQLFVSRPGRVSILEAVANQPLELSDRSIDASVARGTRSSPTPKAPRLIVTLPGEGYRFDGFAPTWRGAPADDVQILVEPTADRAS
jgi:DNA-binding response OmpR family regulator